MRTFRALLALLASLAVLALFAQPALAAPLVTDFNGDGFADLAIGVPFEDVGAMSNAGAVSVLYGSSAGLTTADQLWTQDDTGTDTSESGDAFGSALATGDFDGDGFTDLAIGVPFEDVEAIGVAGAVNVLYGSPIGLTDDGAQFWTQDSTDIEDSSEANDVYGSALAAGDFDGDGRSDLAIGVPFEDVDGTADAGAVSVLHGSSSGLTATGDQFWHQDTSGILDTAEDADLFGWSLAAANFGASSQADLAVGVPGEDIGTVNGAGAVNVLYGSSSGLTTPDQFWHQDSAGVKGTAEDSDDFGWSLAAANFGESSQADLAVGAPGEDIGTVDGAGAVNVLYGASGGLTASGDQFWQQDSSGIKGTAEDGDEFGWSLAAANFGKSSPADLAIGVPCEDIGTVGNAGLVNVLYGASGGLTATGDQSWHQDASGVIDTAEDGDFFGRSLGAANFGKSSQADLAIGVPFEDVVAIDDAGAVNVLYGASGGLTASGDQFVHQDSSGIKDLAEMDDFFGWSLAPPGGGMLD